MSITTAQLLANLPPGDPRRRLVTGQVATKPRATRHHGKAGVVKSEACAAIRRAGAADVAFVVPIRTYNPDNSAKGRSRQFWALDAERKRVETATVVAMHGLKPPALPVVVTLTRVSPSARGLDDHDGLRAALKHLVDEVARWLGCDDGDRSAVQWVYHQRRQPKTHAVEVTVQPRKALAP